MKKLFLTSYFAGVKSCFEDFMLKTQLRKEVLFIPTAGNVEDYKVYIDEAKALFEDLAFKLELLDLASVSQDRARKKISQTPCLYISGGNTFYLLEKLKQKDLLSLIRQRMDEGMIYIGESAGAIITAADITYNQIMDDKSVAKALTDYRALNVVDFAILPHWGEFPFEDSSKQTAKRYEKDLNLLKLNNHQAVWLIGDQVYLKNENESST